LFSVDWQSLLLASTIGNGSILATMAGRDTPVLNFLLNYILQTSATLTMGYFDLFPTIEESKIGLFASFSIIQWKVHPGRLLPFVLFFWSAHALAMPPIGYNDNQMKNGKETLPQRDRTTPRLKNML